MNSLNARPKTIDEAYRNGFNSHVEGQNPFRNCGFETSDLNNAWYRGFYEANPQIEDEQK